MAMSREEIFEEVKEVLIDALGLDDDEVTEDATLMGISVPKASTFWISSSDWKKRLGSRFPVKNCFRPKACSAIRTMSAMEN